jgi:hypothetical protein
MVTFENDKVFEKIAQNLFEEVQMQMGGDGTFRPKKIPLKQKLGKVYNKLGKHKKLIVGSAVAASIGGAYLYGKKKGEKKGKYNALNNKYK